VTDPPEQQVGGAALIYPFPPEEVGPSSEQDDHLPVTPRPPTQPTGDTPSVRASGDERGRRSDEPGPPTLAEA
jgi:hypothetical protein